MAKKFRFPLETLLRVRDLREREAKRKVGLKQAEIARLDQLNRQTADEILNRQGLLRDMQNGRLAPDELVRERAWIGCLRRSIVDRNLHKTGLLGELEKLRKAFIYARMQKKTIEKLRERRFEEYSADRKRREQAEADELAQQLHIYEG